MISLIYYSSFWIILLGIVLCVIHALKKRSWNAALFLLFIPFYPIHYILKKMDDNDYKYASAIMVMGGFVVFAIAAIIRIIYSQPY